MEKNLILAIVLSITVLVIYNLFFMPKPPLKEEVSEAPLTKEEIKQIEKPSTGEIRPVTLENANLILTINTGQATINSWYLKDKKTELLPKDEVFKFYLKLPGGEVFDFLEKNFEIKEKDDKHLVLFLEDEKKKIRITATFQLSQQGYHIFYNLSVSAPSGTRYFVIFPTTIGKKAGDEERLAFWESKLYKEKEEGTKPEYDSRVKWLGIREKNFLAVMVPLNRVEKGAFKIDSWDSWGFITTEQKTSWVIYAGPQSYPQLRLVNNLIKESIGKDYHLTDALKIGVWGYLSVGITRLLIFFYSFTHSYGIAIILLTLLIYGALSPLTFKQFESMQKMQLIQPELRKIQKKFKGDPKKLQIEMMKVYSKYKINPMSGCLPMFIQLPIIFILYRSLLGFPFAENPSFLWIKNLGKPDIPLLLALAGCMFLQQRISQRLQRGKEQEGITKIMQFFPFFLIFILWSLPSGVMLYWFTSTLISTVQQFFISKKAVSV